VADFRYNISDLLKDVYGTGLAARYLRISDPREKTLPDYDFPDLVELHQNQLTSYLGNTFFQRVAFITKDKSYSGNFTDNSGINGFELPDGPLVDVSRPKVIKKTETAGRDGTIKELIHNGDFRIRIRGLLVNYEASFPPIDLTAQLSALVALNDTLEIQCELLNALGIYNVVIEDLQLPSFEQFVNVQPYTITALSDDPVELTLNTDL
jgi:hypothetical protein